MLNHQPPSPSAKATSVPARPFLTLQQVVLTTLARLMLPPCDWLICCLHQTTSNQTFRLSKVTHECILFVLLMRRQAALAYGLKKKRVSQSYFLQVGVLLRWASAQRWVPQIAANCEAQRHRCLNHGENSLHMVKTSGNPKLTNEGMQGSNTNISYTIELHNSVTKMCFFSSQHLPTSLAGLGAVWNSARKWFDTVSSRVVIFSSPPSNL